jgi:CBS-domain-containing membrane protein
MARMRNLIGGHLIATATGLAFLRLGLGAFGGPPEFWMISSVATALVLMMATDTLHSPAGGNPIIVFCEEASWDFLFSPLLIGLAVVSAAALIFRRYMGRLPVVVE